MTTAAGSAESSSRALLAARLRALRDEAADLTDETVARRASMILDREQGTARVDSRRVAEWVAGASVPHRFAVLAAVVTALHEHLARRRTSTRRTAPDLAAWQALWRAARVAPPAVAAPPVVLSVADRTAAEPTVQPTADPVVASAATSSPAAGVPAVGVSGGTDGAPQQQVVAGRPPLLADCFQERAVLAEVLAAAGPDAGSGGTVLVVGAGGTGKTQVAVAVHRVARGRGLDVFWVRAPSRDALLAGYAQAWSAVAAIAGRTAPAAVDAGDVATRADALLSWLGGTSRRWLVVLDDVADPADLAGLWPDGAGSVLVTSRRRDAAFLRSDRTVVDAGTFGTDEAVAYLHRRLGTGRAAEGAPELAEALGGLPLALAQAAAVVLDSATSCTDYLRRLSTRPRDLDLLFPPDTADDYPGTATTTWQLALDRAETLAARSGVAGLARAALELAALTADDAIPEEVWTSSAGRRVLAVRAAEGGAGGRPVDRLDADDARTALRALHRLSLVTHDVEGRRAVTVHALVRRATLAELPAAVVPSLARGVADALVDAWAPELDADSAGAVLRRHAEQVAEHAGPALLDDEVHPLLWRLVRSLGTAGLAVRARERAAALHASAVARWGDDHAQTVLARQEWARWAAAAGDPDQAARDLAAVAADLTRLLGPEAPGTLAARLDLVDALVSAFKPAAAAAADALAADLVRLIGAEHPDAVRAARLATEAHCNAGDQAGSRRRLEQLLPRAAAALGVDHPVVMHVRGDLASVLCATGSVDDGIRLHDEVVAARQRVLGPDHPDTLMSRNNRAIDLGDRGLIDQARAEFEQVLCRQRVVLGDTHPDTLLTWGNVAFYHNDAGDVQAALVAYEDLLVAQRAVGPDLPQTRFARSGHALCVLNSGDVERAVRLYADLLADHERTVGPDDPDALHTAVHLWDGRSLLGDPAAVAELEQLTVRVVAVLGPDHLWVSMTRNRLGRARCRTGDLEAGVADLREALAMRVRLLGPDDRRSLLSRRDLEEWQRRLP